LAHKLAPLAAGALITAVGAGLLVLGVHDGEKVPAVVVELGVAIALSGLIWWVGRQIRGAGPSARADYSALGLVTLIGAIVVGLGIRSGAGPAEVLDAAGAALATVWFFIGLERQYELEPGDAPLWSLPFRILLWPLSGFDGLGIWGNVSGPFDSENLIAQLRVNAELSGEYVVPGSFDADFSPPPADVQKRLDVDLPDELVVWITTTAEQELRLADGDLLSVWPWFLIRAAPVALPPKVIGFADLRTGRDGDDRYAIAIDLRSQPGAGQVVRAKVQSGDLPKWPASQPEVIAADSAAWLASVRLGSAPAAYGQAIRKLREERGRSEEQLASMSNLSQHSIRGIEEGEADPSLVTILRIAEALGVHVSQLALAAEQITGANSN
jgi:XRE family transcriptional regulator, regulator of sulfur utilization